MPLIAGAYRAPWWLPGAHAQTILPSRLFASATADYRRERWETPDADFIEVDFARPEPADPAARVLVLFHGLEGSSKSHYARLLMEEAARRGWRGLVAHFRGCGGEDNRLARAYHSGDSDEIDWVLRRIAQRWPLAPLHAVGISLGGNVLAKWAGERGAQAGLLRACVAVSAPLDLAASGASLERGLNVFYAGVFLRTLRVKAIAKIRAHPGIADAGRVARARTLREFDDAFTAPVHGFADFADYWHRASAKPWLRAITVPMLAINARNDPFLPGRHLPLERELSPQVTLEAPGQGGHAGFFAQTPTADPWYVRHRVFDFLSRGQ